jgi:prepilin-type N-terminal cleavage/methylation domain-containing protein
VSTSAEPAPTGDVGFSLIEVLVVIVIMSAVMAISTAGLVPLHAAYRSASRLQEAQAQVGRAFLRLDGELRYAADLRTQRLAVIPSAYPALIYVMSADTGTCRALSFEGERLTRRVWQPGAAPSPAEVLASGVIAIVGSDPFTVTGGSAGLTPDDVGTAAPAKEVTVAVAVTAGPDGARRRDLRTTFTAPNSEWGSDVSLDDCAW